MVLFSRFIVRGRAAFELGCRLWAHIGSTCSLQTVLLNPSESKTSDIFVGQSLLHSILFVLIAFSDSLPIRQLEPLPRPCAAFRPLCLLVLAADSSPLTHQ